MNQSEKKTGQISRETVRRGAVAPDALSAPGKPRADRPADSPRGRDPRVSDRTAGAVKPDMTSGAPPVEPGASRSARSAAARPASDDSLVRSPSSPIGQGTGVRLGSVSAPVRKKTRTRVDFIKPTDAVRVKGSYDYIFLILVIVLTLFGIIMDFSASYAYSYSRTGNSYYYVSRQILYAAIGFGAMFLAMHFDYLWLRKAAIPIYIGTLGLLGIVLVYGVASGVAQRWIYIGSFTVQPSEIMKLSIVLILALYVARNQDRITNYRNFKQSSIYGLFIPVLIVGLACFMIALEKHFSGTIIAFLIGMVVIFAAGARKGWFIAAGGAAAAIIIPAILFVSYAKERVDMWLHPENYSPTGKIWQTLQGLYAVGSGGLFGVGLGNSRQKHLYVSQPQNDFVFSIIAEELGFAGALLVIVLFMLLIWRGFVIALKAPDTFSSLVVIGLISKIAIQALLNIAVVTNTIPNTGISLPFFSYGGTALIMQLGEMGIVLGISRFSYQREI